MLAVTLTWGCCLGTKPQSLLVHTHTNAPPCLQRVACRPPVNVFSGQISTKHSASWPLSLLQLLDKIYRFWQAQDQKLLTLTKITHFVQSSYVQIICVLSLKSPLSTQDLSYLLLPCSYSTVFYTIAPPCCTGGLVPAYSESSRKYR